MYQMATLTGSEKSICCIKKCSSGKAKPRNQSSHHDGQEDHDSAFRNRLWGLIELDEFAELIVVKFDA